MGGGGSAGGESSLGSLASVLDGLAETPAPPLTLVPGTLIGERFRVLGQIGEGGMGVVFRAHDVKLRRDVAIKVHARQSTTARRRLLAEATAQARVSHPNVVTAYEVGELGDCVFIAMELVEGQTVRAWLAERPRSWREIVGVYLGAGAGLEAVHRAGLVHRDLKPDNILVGADGRVRVADFGLALADGVGGGPAEAEAGRAAGTPAYMAPEQRAGQALDARVDQYALCKALAEALATVRRTPRWLRTVVARGQAADPARRYPELDALLAALSPARRDRRRRLALGALSAAAAAVGLALVLAPRPADCVVRDEDGPWPAARAAAVERAFLATGLPWAPVAFNRVDATLARYAGALGAHLLHVCVATRRHTEPDALEARRLACAEERGRAARALVEVFAVADRAAVESSAAAVEALPELARCADATYLLARVRPPEGALVGAVERLRADLDVVTAEYRAGHYQRALQRGLPLAGLAIATGYLPAEAEAQYALGTVQNFAGQPRESAARLTEAYFGALRAGDDELAARAATELIDVYGFELVRGAEALAWSRHAAAEVGRSARGSALEADFLTQQALLHERQGAYGDALAGYHQALALRRRLGEGQGVLAARLHTHIAAVLDNLGRPRESVGEYRAALAAREGVVPVLHPDNVNTVALLALAEHEAGQPGAALVMAEAAVSIAHVTLGRLHPKTGLAHVIRGTVLRELGALAPAAEEGAEALAIFESTRGPEHPNVALASEELALTYAQLSRVDAVPLARRAVGIYERTLGAEHAHTAIAGAHLGAVLARVEGCGAALPVLERAVVLLDRVNRDGDGASAALVELGRCLAAAGRPEEARAVVRRALALCDERGAPGARARAARALLAELHARGAP